MGVKKSLVAWVGAWEQTELSCMGRGVKEAALKGVVKRT